MSMFARLRSWLRATRRDAISIARCKTRCNCISICTMPISSAAACPPTRRTAWHGSRSAASALGETNAARRSGCACSTSCAEMSAMPFAAAPIAGIHDRRRPVACARHRREHGDLQPRRCRAAETASRRAAGAPVLRRQQRREVPRQQRSTLSLLRDPPRSVGSISPVWPPSRAAVSRSRSTAARSR